MERPSTLLAGNTKNVYMVPRPGRSERTPVKRTVVPLAMLNLVASAAANVPHWHSAKDWLDCGGTSIDIPVSALLPTPHGQPPDPQGTIRPIGVECTPRNGPNPMVCWQLNGTAGIVNWTRATTYALDNGDTNATDVACVFDCAEKSDIVRNLLDSSAPAILATAKPAIAALAATDDPFIAASEFSGTIEDDQFTTRLTASSRRVDRAVDHFVPVPASNTATIAANHSATLKLPATEGKLDFWPTREDVPEDWGIPEPFECTECVEIHPYHFSCKNCSSNRPFCARREFLTGLCDQPVSAALRAFRRPLASQRGQNLRFHGSPPEADPDGMVAKLADPGPLCTRRRALRMPPGPIWASCTCYLLAQFWQPRACQEPTGLGVSESSDLHPSLAVLKDRAGDRAFEIYAVKENQLCAADFACLSIPAGTRSAECLRTMKSFQLVRDPFECSLEGASASLLTLGSPRYRPANCSPAAISQLAAEWIFSDAVRTQTFSRRAAQTPWSFQHCYGSLGCRVHQRPFGFFRLTHILSGRGDAEIALVERAAADWCFCTRPYHLRHATTPKRF